MTTNQHISKQVILAAIYGNTFVSKNSKKRNKYVTIPIHYRGQVYDSYNITQEQIADLMKDQITEQSFMNYKVDESADGAKLKVTHNIIDHDGLNMIEDREDVERLISNAKFDDEVKKRLAKLTADIQLMPVARKIC